MSQIQKEHSKLTIGINDPITLGRALLLGIQHVVAMDVYVVPFIIASLIGLSNQEAAPMIQATFIAAGVATIIQTYFCMKLPVAQGPSFIPIGAVVGIYFATNQHGDGWNTVLGASLVVSIIIILLGFNGVLYSLIERFIPPIVGGTIIFIVGLSLMPIALNDNIFGATGNLSQNIFLSLLSGIALIFFAIIGSKFSAKLGFLRVSSVILALLLGTLTAYFLGSVDLKSVSQASLLTMPQLPFKDFHFSFNVSAILTMVIIYIVLMAETTGTWFAVSDACETKLTKENINRGVIGEGIGCLISALLGSTPVTGYSTNAGIISITGVANRMVFVLAGGWFILFGLSGKLATFISAIPSAVIGGVFVVVCGIICISGLKVIQPIPLGEKEMYTLAVPIIITLALTLIPKEFIHSLPQLLQYILNSAVATASLVAILLNKVLPDTTK